ncbi:MAG: hypothetical protein MJ105_08750 [Lachnospiraceae bacterium]|nr:hypothetical protein [Lachnospiraceae bacterium]
MGDITALFAVVFWFAIVITVIANGIKNSKKRPGNNGTNQIDGQPQQTAAQRPMQQNNMATYLFGQPPVMQQNYGQPVQQTQPGGVIRNYSGTGNTTARAATAGSVQKQPQPGSAKSGTAQNTAKQTVVSTKTTIERAPGQSTTEYLKQKAQRDAAEHRKEEAAELKRRRMESDIPLALRYTGFEVVAPSDRIVVCGYCRAENMVPKYARSKYRCYFCRETI